MTIRDQIRDLGPRTLALVSVVSLIIAFAVAWAVVVLPADDDAAISPAELTGDASGDPDEVARAEIGRAAPAVVLEGLDGPDIDVESLTGTPTLINFWSSGCAPCIKEMPLLEEMHQQLGDDVRFIGVDVAEGLDPGREMIDETGVTYEQTRDPSAAQLSAFDGRLLPHTVVLDADGVVAAIHGGDLSNEDEVLELIDRAR